MPAIEAACLQADSSFSSSRKMNLLLKRHAVLDGKSLSMQLRSCCRDLGTWSQRLQNCSVPAAGAPSPLSDATAAAPGSARAPPPAALFTPSLHLASLGLVHGQLNACKLRPEAHVMPHVMPRVSHKSASSLFFSFLLFTSFLSERPTQRHRLFLFRGAAGERHLSAQV